MAAENNKNQVNINTVEAWRTYFNFDAMCDEKGEKLFPNEQNLEQTEVLDAAHVETQDMIEELLYRKVHKEKNLEQPEVVIPAKDLIQDNVDELDGENLVNVEIQQAPETLGTREDIGDAENLQMGNTSEGERTTSPRQNEGGQVLLTTTAITLALPAETAPPTNTDTDVSVVLVLKKKLLGEVIQFGEPESSSSEAVAVPGYLSFKLPRGYQFQIGMSTEEQQPPQANNNSSARNEGEAKSVTWLSKLINFQLPHDIHQSIEIMDEKSLLTGSFLSLAERLEGWKIKMVARKGEKKIIDKTFHHQQSQETFRSFVEAETYIVYAGRKKHLSKKRKLNKEPLEQEQSQAQLTESIQTEETMPSKGNEAQPMVWEEARGLAESFAEPSNSDDTS